ncbi:MAG: hypothetical protein NWQ55_09265 [Salibacteraceae bacterium]|nr:hypothetical protein [Salibacteraceae bacterium]
MRKFIYILLVLFSSLSCQNDGAYFGPVYTETDTVGNVNLEKSIIIGCEGNFQYSNASLSIIDLDRSEVQNNLYRNANNRAIGDVLQSIQWQGDSLFVVMNNSGSIKILNSKTFEEIDSFDGFVSPRHLQFVGNDEFYVTDLYSNNLIRFNYRTKQIVYEIETEGWQEEMILSDDQLYISNIEKERIDVINLSSNSIAGSIMLSFKPTFIRKLSESLIVVAGIDINEQAHLAKISLVSHKVDEYEMSTSLVGFDVYNDEIYWCNRKSILKIDLENSISVKVLDFSITTPYNFRIQASEGYCVITDARDYISNGSVSVYKLSGQKIGQFEVGIIPQALCFAF